MESRNKDQGCSRSFDEKNWEETRTCFPPMILIRRSESMGRRNVFLVSLALSIGAVLYIRPENIQTVRRKLLLVENEAEPENDTATEEEGSPKID